MVDSTIVKQLIDIFSALLVPTIAIAGISIAYGQFLLNKKRLKHDLFDRRYTIFHLTNEFIYYVISTNEIDTNNLVKFKADTRGARFLFDKSIEKYLDEIYKKVVDIRKTNRTLSRKDIAEEKRNTLSLSDHIIEVEEFLGNELSKIDDVFAPFLSIND